MSDYNNKRIQYYAACYRKDSGSINLWNLVKSNKNGFWCPLEEELISGFINRVPINADDASQLIQKAELYQREKKLIYTSLYLTGVAEVNGRRIEIASPFVYYDAHIEQSGSKFYLQIEPQQYCINDLLLKWIAPNNEQFPSDNARYFNPQDWVGWLQTNLPRVELSSIFDYPRLNSRKSIRALSKQNSLAVSAFSQLLIVDKPKGSRGVLHELSQMQADSELSAPLKSILGSGAQTKKSQNRKAKNANQQEIDFSLPVLLSESQKKALRAAKQKELSILYGPPGTGKSYTIAAVACEHMARGESVLIVANNEHALDVIEEKLNQVFQLNDLAIRAGSKQFLKDFKRYINDLLKGYISVADFSSLKSIEKNLKSLNKKLQYLDKKFIRYSKRALLHSHLSQLRESKQINLYQRIRLNLLAWRQQKPTRLYDTLCEIKQAIKAKEALAQSFLLAGNAQRKQQLIENDRLELKQFNQAIRARTSLKQTSIFENIDYTKLNHAFNIWLVSLDTLHKVLPLKKSLFDLVIFDEATQSNVALSLPAIQRAKRCMVVGDSKQLRHYSFVSRQFQTEVLAEQGLSIDDPGVVSYRDKSILDLAYQAVNDSSSTAFLDEHFRSVPKLIDFSNQHFYHSRLKVMQHRPDLCNGDLTIFAANGARNEAGVNQQEAQALIDELKKLILDCQELNTKPSIGVISPFRSQVDYLNHLLEKKLEPAHLTSHAIRCATPYGFQGEERDIMLISFAIDAKDSRAASYLNQADMFNVCVTRAKTSTLVYTSVTSNDLKANNLLRLYLESITTFKRRIVKDDSVDQFQEEVVGFLAEQKIKYWRGHFIAGQYIDVFIKVNKDYFAIDLIGYPGAWYQSFDINTYKILARAKIEVIPLAYIDWKQSPKEALLNLIKNNVTKS
ncbi:AAA domain-containing protein [Aliikangiella sp. IMCC44632]